MTSTYVTRIEKRTLVMEPKISKRNSDLMLFCQKIFGFWLNIVVWAVVFPRDVSRVFQSSTYLLLSTSQIVGHGRRGTRHGSRRPLSAGGAESWRCDGSRTWRFFLQGAREGCKTPLRFVCSFSVFFGMLTLAGDSKSVSTKGPGRGATYHLTDFDETWQN